MAPAKHFLRKTIFPCDVDGHMIVLDLAADRYSRVGDAEAEALRYLFGPQSGAQADTPAEAGAETPESYEAAIKTLMEQGILAKGPCDGPSEGRDTFPAMPAQATLDMKGWPHDGNPKIRTSHVINCARAFVRAKFMRRFYPIERIVGRITRRRERELAKAGKRASRKTALSPDVSPDVSGEAELARIRELVEVFRILKVLFYTAKDHCLFDSLTLVEFLSFYRIYPLWVFGVQMGPFQAHCWVQDSTHIYNDSVTHTDFFTPIMTA